VEDRWKAGATHELRVFWKAIPFACASEVDVMASKELVVPSAVVDCFLVKVDTAVAS
jgi:hypothetical protein